jgi:hypothetical protein
MARLRPHEEGQKHNHSPGLIVSPADNSAPPVQRHKTGRVDSAVGDDRLLKRGQLTLPRVLSLAAIAGFIVAAVSLGGVWLTIGYWAITLGFCLLLFLIAIDYGVEMEKAYPEHRAIEPVKTEAGKAASDTKGLLEPADLPAATAQKPQLRAKRQARRRRF